MGRDGLERGAGVVEPHRHVLRRAGLVRVDRADDVVGLGDDADLGRVLRALGDHLGLVVAGGVVVAVVRVLARQAEILWRSTMTPLPRSMISATP